MKESIRAAADALLIAATSVVAVVCVYTLSRSDRTNRPEAARQLDPSQVRTLVAHRTDCDEAPFHFVIGNGVLYGDGEVVETDAWRARTPYPGLPDPDDRRRTAAVGIVMAGRPSPTPMQRLALEDLARRLRADFTMTEIGIESHCDVSAASHP